MKKLLIDILEFSMGIIFTIGLWIAVEIIGQDFGYDLGFSQMFHILGFILILIAFIRWSIK